MGESCASVGFNSLNLVFSEAAMHAPTAAKRVFSFLSGYSRLVDPDLPACGFLGKAARMA
jgi:hypothetical protein